MIKTNIESRAFRLFFIPLSMLVFSSFIRTDDIKNIKEFDEIIFVTRKTVLEHWYANFGYLSFDENKKLYFPGSSLCKLNAKTGQLQVLFQDETGTFRDPQVHYDGKKIVVSYRKGGTEDFHLYETDTDGSYLKQLTFGPYSDIEPTYLPDGDIIFISSRCECWVNCWASQVATLYRCKADGTGVTKLSANIEHDNTPWVLSNGQVMYTRWEYVDRSQVHFHHLWVMNPDGSKQTVLFGNQMTSFDNPGSCVLIDAKPVPWSSDTVLVNYSPGHGQAEHAGYPALLSLSNGPDDKTALILAKGKKGLSYDPYPINRNYLLASRDENLLLMDYKGGEQPFFKLPDNFSLEDQKIFEARPVLSREREPIVASSLEKDVDYGTYVLQNVYEGRNMQDVEKGSVKQLLILETMPKPINYTGGNEPLSYSGSFTMERILGTVPVHEDGSAHFRLPANRPFLFIALDKDERAIQKMKSFTSAVPGEVVSCIGCHEKRSLAPANRGQIPVAMAMDPVYPEPVKNVPAVLDFSRDIQPILDRTCVKCHKPENRMGGVLLTGDHGPTYSHSYFNLMARFQVNDGFNQSYPLNKSGMVGDMNSALVKKIEEHHGGVEMSLTDLRTIRYWINTGGLYPGTYGALGTGMVGVMTINNADMTPVQNEAWAKAISVIQRTCKKCHDELMDHIVDERNISWWDSRVSVTSGEMDEAKYKEAIRFSRHIIYNLTKPENSTVLLAPLSKEAGGYGLCQDEKTGDPLFSSREAEEYKILSDAVNNSAEYLKSIKRFDMEGFIVRKDYYREMKRYGVIDEGMPIEQVDPYVADSIYWSRR